MTLTFVGHGYVGLVTAAVFANLGNTVYVIGRTPEKIEALKKGKTPFYEPGLSELVSENLKAQRLIFTLDYNPAVKLSDVVFIAVGTPPQKTGDAELSGVFDVVGNIAKNLEGYTVVATKSTVPVGTNKKILQLIKENKPQKAEFDVASVPEFLKEGTAIQDTMHPDRVVIGTESERARKVLTDLHEPFSAPFVQTNLETAELIKYASNAFLATKISFANAIAKLSELSRANASSVLDGIGYDKRIGRQFLYPGPGYGGSCLPKDVRALHSMASDLSYDFGLLSEVEAINKQARRDLVIKTKKLLEDELRGKKIAVWGLAFKPNTDDMRESPAIDIIELLKREGAKVSAYDPEALENAKRVVSGIVFEKTKEDCIKNAECLIIVTDWDEFKETSLEKIYKLMKKHNIVDGRNLYDPIKAKNLGFNYVGVGR